MLPTHTHTHTHSRSRELAMDSPPPSPTTPTQAITRTNSSPTTTLPSPTSPTTTKQRARALTITSSTPSYPRPPQSPREKLKPITIPVPSSNTITSPILRDRQNSTQNPTTITSPRSSPPPDFLLDDDPFANLTRGGRSAASGGARVARQSSLGDIKVPRSPLSNDEGRGTMKSPTASTTMVPPPLPSPPTTTPRAPTTISQSTPTSPAHSTFYGNEGFGMRSSFPSIASSSSSRHSATSSSGSLPRKFSQPSPITVSRHPSFPHQPHRPSPAHQRPAFKSRPSLPSLDTLAKMTFVPGAGLGARKRKGKVGAGLPFEPWNNLDSHSGETSPVSIGAEGTPPNGDEVGGEAVPPVPPLPPSVSVSRSKSVSSSLITDSSRLESLNSDPKFSLSSPSPALRHSSSSPSPSSSSTTSPPQTFAPPPPTVSLAPASSPLTCQPIPVGQQPLLPSQILALGSEVGVVYGNGMMPITELGSPSRSPPLPPPPLSIPRSPVSPSADIGATLRLVDVLCSSPKEADLDFGLVDCAKGDEDDGVGTEVRGYDADADDSGGAGGAGDASDVDVDRFMDQFMDHYDREESQRDDGTGLELQKEKEADDDDDDDIILVGRIGRRLAMDEDALRTLLLSVRPPSPISPPPATATATSPIERAYAMSDVDTVTPDSVSVDTSSAILAPTLRARTRTTRMVTTATATTTSNGINKDSEADDSSFFDSYLYHPSREEPTTFHHTSSSGSPSCLTPPPPPPPPPRDFRWSPSAESVPGSRSRSLSSTYTSLSFGSESESSSGGPQSSFSGDDDNNKAGGGGRISRYYNNNNNNNNSNVQCQPPPTQITQSPKSAEEATIDTVLVSSPPMQFSGTNHHEDHHIGYFVPFSGGGGLRSTTIVHHHHHNGVHPNTTDFGELSINNGDDDNNNNNPKKSITTVVQNFDDNDDNDDKAGESTAGPFNPRIGGSRRRSVGSKLRLASGAVVKGLAESEEEKKAVDEESREEIIIMEKKHDPRPVAADEVETEDDVEVGNEEEVEWEYVVGGNGPFQSMGGISNGSNDLEKANKKPMDEIQTIAIATPDKKNFFEPVIIDDDDDDEVGDEVVDDDVTRHSPPPPPLLPLPPLPPISNHTSMTRPTAITRFKLGSDSDELNLGYGSSSSAVAAALAMSTWERQDDGLKLRDGNGNGSYSSSSIHKSGGFANLNTRPFESKGYNGRRSGGVGDDVDEGDEQRMRRAALERRRDQTSFLAISSESSSASSSSSEDDYGLASSSPSQLVMNVNLRTQLSRTVSRVPSSEYLSASTSFPVASGSRGSSAGGSRFFDDSDDDDVEEEEEEEEEEEDTQQANNAHHDGVDDDDDDIPLAKRIPSALTAQKSIRHQVRQEREQKKKEKALRSQTETARTRLMTLRPTAAAAGGGGIPSSTSHDTATVTSSSSQVNQQQQQQYSRRHRTQTLTGKGSISGNPFSPEDLAKKLRDIDEASSSLSPIGATSLYQQQQQQQQQARLHTRNRSKSVSRSSWDSHPAEALPPPVPHIGSTISQQAQRTKSVKDPSSSYRYYPSSSSSSVNSPHIPSLRPMRSFHRSSTERRPIGVDDPRFVTSDAEQRVGRSSTTSITKSSSTRDGPQQQTSTIPITTPHRRSFSQSRSSIDRPSPMTISEPVPPIPTTRISHDEHRKLTKVHHYEPVSSRVGSTRTSVVTDNERLARTSSHQQHRLPPAPAPAPTTALPPDPPSMPSGKSGVVVQQRVFVGDMQRFKMVEISGSTTAGDVIEMIEAEGSLTGLAGSGGWMVFEVAQDFGMERPIRSFELVSDVQASWNKDKMVNYLVLRLTPLAVPLNRSAIPSSSPTHSGYVEWEVKRGKWSKRWMQLREHSIWLAKRDNGRDEVQLCSLSNFDAYQVTRSHRAPKPFAFAVKSTDKLSFFENTADYLHSFACSEKDGKVWMEKILVARSYVLFQERHVLFNPKAANGNASGGLTRGVTRKTTSQRPTAAQPLLNMPSTFTTGASQQPHHDVFEPNSLLSKQL